jgi:hypothetical protein
VSRTETTSSPEFATTRSSSRCPAVAAPAASALQNRQVPPLRIAVDPIRAQRSRDACHWQGPRHRDRNYCSVEVFSTQFTSAHERSSVMILTLVAVTSIVCGAELYISTRANEGEFVPISSSAVRTTSATLIYLLSSNKSRYNVADVRPKKQKTAKSADLSC